MKYTKLLLLMLYLITTQCQQWNIFKNLNFAVKILPKCILQHNIFFKCLCLIVVFIYFSANSYIFIICTTMAHRSYC